MGYNGDLYPTAGADAVMTTTGDLVRYNAGSRQRLGIGSSSDILTVSGGLPAWVAPASGSATVTTQTTVPTNGSTTTSGTHVTIPNGTITLPTRSGGFCFISAIASLQPNTVPANCKLGIYFNGALQVTQTLRADVGASNEYGNQVTSTDSLDGGNIEMQFAVNTGTLTLIADAANSSSFQTLEVS